MPHHFSCGVDYALVRDLKESLDKLNILKYHFACMPIVHPRFRRDFRAGKAVQHAFTRTDMLLTPTDWNLKVVGKISPYLDLDSNLPHLRQHHEDIFIEEMGHSRSLGLSTVIVSLKGPQNTNLARVIHSQTQAHHSNSFVWVRVPMEDPRVTAFKQPVGYLEENPIPATTETVSDAATQTIHCHCRDEAGTWKWWADFHRVAEWDRRIGLALELPAELPDPEEISRWLGEPVKCLILPTHVFTTNRKGYPTLSKPHQNFVHCLMGRGIHLVVTGCLRHADMGHYQQYLEHLWNSKKATNEDVLMTFAEGWEDHLQTPLQPLSDNLDSHTYSIFEKDPVKYDAYQDATIAALKDRYPHPPKCQSKVRNKTNFHFLKQNSDPTQNGISTSNLSHSGISSVNIPANSNEGNPIDSVSNQGCANNSPMRVDVIGRNNEEVQINGVLEDPCPNQKEDGSCGCRNYCVIMVLGAGRGPLVRAVLNAGEVANVDVQVYAVEKNPAALLALFAQQREIWYDKVTVVASDMRDFQPPRLADIVVSELLGSFGDNELSPECLDGARHLLRTDGISIPCSYTSHLNPVMSARLWSHVRDSESLPSGVGKPPQHQLETLWVVYQQNKYDIAAPQPLFTFTHPCPVEGRDVERRRWSCLRFEASRSSTLHGFSGYFSCVLYGQHTLSILPSDHSPSMISWFPVYCPIKNPIAIKPGDTIEVNFWRCCSARKVWYEWNVTSPQVQVIHNQNGRSSDMIL